MKTFYIYQDIGDKYRFWGPLLADNWVDARTKAVSLWGISFGNIVAASTLLPLSIVAE